MKKSFAEERELMDRIKDNLEQEFYNLIEIIRETSTDDLIDNLEKNYFIKRLYKHLIELIEDEETGGYDLEFLATKDNLLDDASDYFAEFGEDKALIPAFKDYIKFSKN